ncbi:carboxypeptidase regulatory-like domain-containing protein [Aeoliella sp. SH292]|uniref:carboxypeptidase regulatory-like domain-containing protein n=1 Tax=Aeoliella sp. SH292 TaxID=3454464 RepID=UPI003F978091
MTTMIDAVLQWFADYYLFSTLLLALVLLAGMFVRQPARRLGLAWAAVGGLFLLGGLLALPNWTKVSLSRPVTNTIPATPEVVPPDPTIQPIPLSAPTGGHVSQNIPTLEFAPSPKQTKVEPPRVREIDFAPLLFVSLVLGSTAALLWLLLGAWQTHRLVGASVPAPPEMERLLAALAGDDGALPRLRLSSQVGTAVALGLRRPTILLPEVYTNHDGLAVRSMLAHELAHLRHGDLWMVATLRCFMIVLWAHPLYWLLRRRVRLDQEMLADAAAADLTSRTDYAKQLVGWARELHAHKLPTLAGAVGLWETRSQLRRRIAVLLDERMTVLQNCSRGWKVAAVALCLSTAFALSLLTVRPGEAMADEIKPAVGEVKDTEGEKATAKIPTATLHLRVVDERGNPIEGAEVSPSGLRAPNDGSWYGWYEGSPGRPTWKTYRTDAAGKVSVVYPKYVLERKRTSVLIVDAAHPDFANDDTELAVESPNPTVVLKAGGRIKATAKLADGSVPVGRLFAVLDGWGKQNGQPVEPGTIRSEVLAAEKRSLRVVYLPEQGVAQFSPLISITPKVGETVQATTQLHPGTKLVGTVDEIVPRPVKNGYVVAKVITTSGGEWSDTASIAEDGTFVFDSLPCDEGEVAQMVGVCDGYVSTPPGGWSNGTETPKPQVVHLRPEEVRHNLLMSPSAEVILSFKNLAGEPIAGVKAQLCPNIVWNNGGSTLFAHPRTSSKEYLLNPDAHRAPIHLDTTPYGGVSDEQGRVVLLNLPPTANCMGVCVHDDYQLPTSDVLFAGLPTSAMRLWTVPLVSGETALREMILEAKGDTLIGTDGEVLSEEEGEDNPEDATAVAGIVLGPDGKPLPGVDVDAWTWHPGNETTTDAEGRFQLTGFTPREAVEIEFTKAGYCPRYFVSKEAGTRNWVVRLDNDTWMEGMVTDPDGKPVANVEVRAERGPFENPNGIIGEVQTATRSDDAGRYKLLLEPDTYRVQVRGPEGFVSRQDGLQLLAEQHLENNIALQQGLTFRAKILDSESSEPVKDITLWNWRNKGIEGTSGEDGILEIHGMFPGKFEFQVTAKGTDRYRSWGAGDYVRWWSAQAANEYQRKDTKPGEFQRNFDDLEFDLQNTDAPSEAVTIWLEKAAIVRGRVVDPDGNPVVGATVAPAKTGSGNSLTGDTRFSYTTDDDGKFEAKLPASGGVVYNLIAHDGKYNEWRNWANATGEPFSTSPGQEIESVELRLTRGATVRGRVLNAAGEPIAQTLVRAVPTNKLDNRYYNPEVRTDDEGRYELKFIQPGENLIQAEPFWLQAEMAPAGTSRTVDLKAGEELAEEVVITP